MFKKTVLENGLRIITVPETHTKAVTVMVLVGTGSKYENKEINGISHFLEHMFFKGTPRRPTKTDISEPFDRVGGIYNAFTGEDYTGYWAKVEKSHFDLALDIISDMFLNSKLEEGEINRERGVINEEINMYYDDPMSHVQLLWTELLYGDQPAGRPIAGTKESVSGINREKMVEYFTKQYVAKNTIVCLGGNFDEKEAIEKVKGYFTNIRSGSFYKKDPVVEKQEKPALSLHFRETDQTHICLGFRGYSLNHPQKYAQELLAVALGGMMSSRMFLKIREEMGLAYYISAISEQNPETGFIQARAGLDNNRIEQAIVSIVSEYKRIKEEGIGLEELKKAKDNVIGKMTLALEASDAMASFYAIQDLLEEKTETPEQYFSLLNKVTPEDIKSVANDIFRPENMNLAIIGPYKEAEKFTKLLNI
ncbi:MAG TPA: pitrilysin family protein [Candidatus Pacearchaeota archaeon]|nr:pitrilysin family protein [Candidatus Pacearchaeota archaeon]